MEQKMIIGGVVLLVLAAVGVFVFAPQTATNPGDVVVPAGKYTTFAQCIKDSGATFFGAFWCPHCKAQKALFGDAVEKLPYVECSTPDGKDQTQVCKDAGVVQYPTWVFADMSTSTGEVPLATLAEKTNCTLPQ